MDLDGNNYHLGFREKKTERIIITGHFMITVLRKSEYTVLVLQ